MQLKIVDDEYKLTDACGQLIEIETELVCEFYRLLFQNSTKRLFF